MSVPEILPRQAMLPDFDYTPRRAHLLGICGSGMKPLAYALLSMGVEVSGTDPASGKEKGLAEKGVRLFDSHAAANLGNPDLLVYSSAISPDNPEMEEARRRGLRIVHRSEMLGWFLARKESMLIAGTHGKTTTTGMAALLFEAAGFDPWAFIGGSLPQFGGNLRIGGDRWAVAEADESDGTFLNLPRDHAVITNIEAEHLNYWGSEERIFQGFKDFLAGMPSGGRLVVCLDDPGVRRLLGETGVEATCYSITGMDAPVQAKKIELRGASSSFDWWIHGECAGRVALGVPGSQNVANALGALALAVKLGADPRLLVSALEGFHGVNRRFTRRESKRGYLVIDDYGHHPTEITATMAAARLLANERGGRLHVVFQPHRYTRTRNFHDQFGPALNGADTLILTDIYAAGEPPIEGVTASRLRDSLEKTLPINPRLVEDFEEIQKSLQLQIKNDDIVLLLGAGSVTTLADLLCSG